MTVEYLLDYCMDAGMLDLEIYDYDTDSVVYKGSGDEVPDDLLDEEVSSWDPPYKGVFTINIDRS